MSHNSQNYELIVLAPAWPGNTDGYGFGIRASILLYLERYSVIHFICISDQSFADLSDWPSDRIEWTHIPISKKPLWLRFLRSLVRTIPAIALQYADKRRDAMRAVDSAVQKSRGIPHIIFEDIALACFLPDVERAYPETKTAIRSHNMSEQVFETFLSTGSPIHRLSWRIEFEKIRRFEKRVCEKVDRFWAVSGDDADEYVNRMSLVPDGVVGQCLDVERYQNVENGEVQTVVHVGTIDFRKGKGLTDFIQQVWPLVRAKIPDARLILAGRGSKRFTDAELGIEGLGFVDDDRDILRQGQIFLNSQMMGGGVQLKSIVAMLAGKTLVSTPLGVGGVQGQDGNHFVIAISLEKMASVLVSLMQNPEHARDIGQKAREFAMQAYSTERFLAGTKPLIDDFIHGVA